jgi:archaeosine synthase beta-subunit
MYPAVEARDRFVLERRGPRHPHDPWRYQNVVVEDEPNGRGTIARVATIFLTGRECPWRCVMCDLWRNTTTSDTPPGAIPAQIAAARRTLAHETGLTQIKLYNSGNFFDQRAVPGADYPRVASELAGFDRVIVESHPALIGPPVDRFLDALASSSSAANLAIQLEVAMGLETANPLALERLHKRMTIDHFTSAAGALKERGVALRVFLLISPPFVPPDEQDGWLLRSIDVAFSCGATAVSLIPTRPGNGAMEALEANGFFRPPSLEDIERSVDAAHVRRHPGRIFVDLWDLERFSRCSQCIAPRRARLHAINMEQARLPPPSCSHCGGGDAA